MGVARDDEERVYASIRERADVPKVAALVNAAYGHYVERIGMLPRPMTDDYAEVIANHRVERSGGGESLIDECLAELGNFTGRDWEQEDDITLVTFRRDGR